MSVSNGGEQCPRSRFGLVLTVTKFKEEPVVKHMEKDLQTLVVRGKSQGYLTYDDVNGYLPDQDVTPEKLDNLLVALEDMGIELVDKPPVKPGQPQLKKIGRAHV